MENFKVHYYFTDSEDIKYCDTVKAKTAEKAKDKLIKETKDLGNVVVTLVEGELTEVRLFKQLISNFDDFDEDDDIEYPCDIEIDGVEYQVRQVIDLSGINAVEYCELYEKTGEDEETDPYEYVSDMPMINVCSKNALIEIVKEYI